MYERNTRATFRATHAAVMVAVLLGLGTVCTQVELAWAAGQRLPRGLAETAQAELDVLASRVAGFRVLNLPATAGETVLSARDALTIERLRGVRFDDAPPEFRGPAPAYDRPMADDCPAQARPYLARGIEPFRFRHFHCEFNYGLVTSSW
jgi:hypothetical protein